MSKQELTQQQLQDVLWYRRDTGEFFWRLDRGPVKAGDRAGCASTGRLQIVLNGQMYEAHRLAWLYVYGELPKGAVFHIAPDSLLDNRIENLRLQPRRVTRQPPDVVKCPGVRWSPRDNKWLAGIVIKGKLKYLGVFVDHGDAVKARKAAEVERQIPAPPEPLW